jgi:excinuclease ABC subunit A
MVENDIVIKGARVHNLRGVSLTLPKGKLICLTGVSGSGKSSLAFDTVYAEGRRRYVESLSSYARQFLGTQEKPDVDLITGLSPTISIQQKTAGDNPRSTVGTVTQVHDFLRVLYARLGTQLCPKCGQTISAQTRDQIADRILALPAGTRRLLLAPVIRGQKGEYRDLFSDLRKQGYSRARVDGKVVSLSDSLRLDKMVRHTIEVVVDRLAIDPAADGARVKLSEAVGAGLELGDGVILIVGEDGTSDELLLSSKYACPACGIGFEAPSPQLLSFNSPQGMCGGCDGLGTVTDFDAAKLVADPKKSFLEGAIATHEKLSVEKRRRYETVAKALWFSLRTPWKDIPAEKRDKFLNGDPNAALMRAALTSEGLIKVGGGWPGLIAELREAYRAVSGDLARRHYEKYMTTARCPDCKGRRLNPQALAVRLRGTLPDGAAASLSIADASALSISDAQHFFRHLELTELQRTIGQDAVKEVVTRLQFLIDVGLEYLTLDRAAPTLSGGEAQRIRLAAQVGCGLVGVLYVLDEPSIGLHPRDNVRLIASLKALRDMGNTVVVVEHDEDTMRAADRIIDFGPGPGVKGGEVVFSGGWGDLTHASGSVTADYLTGRRKIEVPKARRPVGRAASGESAKSEPTTPKTPSVEDNPEKAKTKKPTKAKASKPAKAKE